MGKNRLLVGCLVALLFVLIIGGGLAIFIANIPPVSAQVIPGSAYMMVTLSTPLSGASLPLNSFTQVNADAVGQKSISRLEFWVDNQLIAQNNLPNGSNLTHASAFWSWTPPAAGDYILLVRAYDADNHFAVSNAVRVHADDSADRMTLQNHTVQQNDTIDSLAKQNNIPPAVLLSANPSLSEIGALPAGGSINIPVPAPPILSSSSTSGTYTKSGGKPTATPTNAGASSYSLTQAAPTATPIQKATQVPTAAPNNSIPSKALPQNGIPKGIPFNDATHLQTNKVTFWVDQNITIPITSKINNSALFVQPSISASIQGCNANLSIYSGGVGAQAFFLYRLDPLSSSYKLIATLPGPTSKLVLGYLDTGLYGKFSYYVVAVSGPLQVSSDFLTIDVGDQACNQGYWSSLIVTRAFLTTPVTGGVYCYLTLNNNPWGRIPGNGVVPYVSGGYDLKPYFPALSLSPFPATITMGLDCWGYINGIANSLGKASRTFSTSTFPVNVAINGSDFDITLIFDKGIPPPGSQTAPSDLTPPVSLRGAQSGTDCVSHMGSGLANLFTSLVCGSAMTNHYQVLIWEWKAFCVTISPECAFKNQIDGYRIYRVANSGQTSLVQEQQGTDVKAYAFPQPAPDANGALPCFIVRSYKGTDESINSNLFCLPATGTGAVNLKLTPSPDDLYFENAFNEAKSGNFGCPFNGTDYNAPYVKSTDGSVGISYFYAWDPGAQPDPCWSYDNKYSRGDIGFDMTAVPQKVYNAVLSFNVTGYNNNNFNGNIVCGASLNLATNFNGETVTGFDSIVPISAQPSQKIDVSGTVRNWQATHPGGIMQFMINTNNENLDARQNDSCGAVTFNNFLLTVNYFPQ